MDSQEPAPRAKTRQHWPVRLEFDGVTYDFWDARALANFGESQAHRESLSRRLSELESRGDTA